MRDNVPPSYLRELRAAVLDGMHREINGQDVASEWVNQALSTAASDAVSSVLDAKYGQRRCSYSVDDPEANKRAVAAGYSVIPPRAFSKEQWANIRQADCVEPAGKLFPTPRPYSPNGRPERVILETDWTPAMKRTAEYSRHLGELLFGAKITVRIINEPTVGWDANYGHCVLTLNLGRLGRDWFDSIGSEEMHALLLHEFAHHFEFDHLSDAYYGAICRLGAKLTALALRSPQLLGSSGTGAGVSG